MLGSINASFGSGYNPTPNSIVYLRNLALAKVILDAWLTNQRLANQAIPSKLTTFLSRWEQILALPADPTLSDVDRRNRIAEIWSRWGQQFDTQYLTDKMASILGPLFVAVEFISYAIAVVHAPNGTYPWGTVDPSAPWYSSTAHILVRTQVPAGWGEGQYRIVIAKANLALDALVPAWITWTVYRPPTSQLPTNVVGGPSAGGVYCDEDNTCDMKVLVT